VRGLGSTFLRLEEVSGGFEIETNREAAMMIRSTPHVGEKCYDRRFALPHLCSSRD
jgi:hypothetical protein